MRVINVNIYKIFVADTIAAVGTKNLKVKKETAMMIPVVYNSGKHDIIKAELLNRLLGNGLIEKFKRASGWVKVGSDPIRKIRQEDYPERLDRRQYAA